MSKNVDKSSNLKLVYTSSEEKDVKKLVESLDDENVDQDEDKAHAIQNDLNNYFKKFHDSDDLDMENMVVISVSEKKDTGEKILDYLGFSIDEDRLDESLHP